MRSPVSLALWCACLGLLAGCGGGGKSSEPTATLGTETRAATASQGSSPSPPTSSPAEAQLPNDICALVAGADVKARYPDADAGKASTSDPASPVKSVICTYEWPDKGSIIASVSTLEISVSLPSRGTTPAMMRSGWQANVKDAGANGQELQGIGDFAVFTSVIGGNANARALVKGFAVEVELSGVNARQQKDNLIALLKLAVSKL